MFWKKRKQQAVIAGCGKLGARIAIALQQNAYEVTVIDVRRENFHRLPCDIRIKAIAAAEIAASGRRFDQQGNSWLFWHGNSSSRCI